MSPNLYRVCVIDDDEIMGEALKVRFELEGFTCDWVKSARPALTALRRTRFDVVVCDIRLPDMSGAELFQQLVEEDVERPPFIFITGYGEIDAAVRLLKLGAHDYLTKPLNVHYLLETVRKLCLESAPEPATDHDPILGISSAMRGIEAMLPRIAKNADTVLVTGESGVGKEQVARALHAQADPREQTPFVAVNCGAITESLMEAELFGHLKGSFTGAIRNKKGYFEQANGGTLLLDEVGEMSPTMQVKLLRAIQERQVVRVGDERPIAVNLRLICATHQDLKQMVEENLFREDLYYRINIIHLHIPPLRERRDDIIWLARRILGAREAATGDQRQLHRTAEQALLEYPWPGNIRELKHCLERACIMSPQQVLTAEMLFSEAPPTAPEASFASLADYLATCEKRYIEDNLRAHGGKISATAATLGISRKSLWEKMKKLQINDVSS